MVIDPKLYERVSGRSADPTERLAMANAAMAGRRAGRGEATPTRFSLLRGRWLVSIVLSIVVMIVVVTAMISPAATKRFWQKVTGQQSQRGTQPTPPTE